MSHAAAAAGTTPTGDSAGPRTPMAEKLGMKNASVAEHPSGTKKRSGAKKPRAGAEQPPKELQFIPDERHQHRVVSIDDFDVGRKLGEGAYGKVYAARDKVTNLLVAIKKVDIMHLMHEGHTQTVQRELEIMQQLRHPHILQMYTYFWGEKFIYIVLEFAEKGDIYQLLEGGEKHFSAKLSAKYTAQLCEAIEYIHQRDVMHRDIKPENLLVDTNGDLKLADFGWGVQDPALFRTTWCGTADYMPPEMLAMNSPASSSRSSSRFAASSERGPDGRQGYSNKVDTWAVGVFLYECLHGSPPFPGEHQQQSLRYQKHSIRTQSFSFPRGKPGDKDAFRDVPQSAKDLIRLLLVDADKRPSLRDVIEHPFLQEYYYRERYAEVEGPAERGTEGTEVATNPAPAGAAAAALAHMSI